MSECAKFWAGEFGDAYTRRNRVDWRARIPFWRTILDITGARSVFEFGCNAGWNLSAIQRVDPLAKLFGCDVNGKAIEHARSVGHNVFMVKPNKAEDFGWVFHHELVFTAGVLIHVPPAELQATMRRLVDLSSDWVLAIEYDADTETEVEYRGHAGRLWKRNYGRLYQDMGLELVETGPADGFDRCTYWLMRKTA